MLLRTLGGLSLEGASFHRPKPLLLLAYLALEGPTERRYLAELFWMEAANARRSLATALSQVRGSVPEVIHTDDVRVWTTIECDARNLHQASGEEELLDAFAAYRGPFLEGLAVPECGVELEEWIYATRETLAGRAREALLALAERNLAAGDLKRASQRAERAYRLPEAPELDADDLARVALLLRAVDSPLVKEVEKEATMLGVRLPPTLRREETPPSPVVAVRPEPHSVAPLPDAGTSFVGRERELRELAGLLEQPTCRLVSITGLGGAGKTRLALRLAQERRGRDPSQLVAFVSLEAVAEAALIPARIATALGISPAGARDPLAQVAERIGARRALLVLDNLEHLLDGASLLPELLRACPNLKVLTTSRERLGLAEEWVFALDGLTLPSDTEDARRHAPYFDALELFRQRARRTDRSFSVTDDNAGAVLRLCQLTQGLPLGIELAAALTRAVPLAELVRELETDLDVLSSLERGTPDRHKSLQAVFEHSWRLLPAVEQEVLRALAVFHGGFTRRAAADVACASIPLLASLVDKSLVQAAGGGRYDLHPLVRTYAARKLARDDEVERRVQELHAVHFLGLLETNRDAFPHRDTARAIAEIEADLANVLSAWAWAARNGRHDLLEDAVHPLGWFLSLRGRPAQGLDWAGTPPHPPPGSLLAMRQLLWRGWFLNVLDADGPRKALACIQQAIHLAEQLDARPDLAFALRMAGLTYSRQNPHDDASALAASRRALALYQELGDVEGTAMMLNNLACQVESPEEALGMLRAGLQLAREAGETHAIAKASETLAELLYCLGDYAAARSAAEESVACHEATGFTVQAIDASLILGEVLLALGDAASAEALARRVLELSEALPESAAVVRGRAHALLGHVERELEAFDRAHIEYHRTLHLLQGSGRDRDALHAVALSRLGLARIALVQGRVQEARTHADETLALLTPYERTGLFYLRSARWMCSVPVGEALAAEGEHERAEEGLRDVLKFGRAWVPAVLEALAAIAALRQHQGRGGEAREILLAVASHPASSSALAARARATLEGKSPLQAGSGSHEALLEKAILLAMHGARNA